MSARKYSINRLDGWLEVLGLVGLAAWMLYILACRAAWSPDGSKILFSYFDPQADEAGVVLYDREDETTRTIFVAHSPNLDDALLFAQWESTGRRAIIARPTDDSLEVIVLPLDSAQPARHFHLPESEDTLLLPPYPEIHGNLYIGGDYLARLNLQTGEQTVQEPKSPLGSLLTHDGRLFYARQVPPESEKKKKAEKKTAEKEKDANAEEEDKKEDLEVGEVNLNDLTLKPLFTLSGKELEEHGVKELGFLAFDPTGTRLAINAEGEDKDLLLLCTLAGLEKTLTPEFPAAKFKLGNPEWSPDGRIIYVPVLTPAADSGWQYAVGEIPVEGGPARLDPIAVLDSSVEENFQLLLQVSLSPDGATLATTTALLDQSALPLEARGLYLLAVRDPERKLVQVPVPRRPQPVAPPGKE